MLALGCSLSAQSISTKAAPDEFPGLQVLPPGSVIKGISVPRYEKHKATALLKADELTVDSRSRISIKGVHATFYDKGEEIIITCDKGSYDFKHRTVVTDANASVTSPRFSLKGKAVKFSTVRGNGFIQGPITTEIDYTPEEQPAEKK